MKAILPILLVALFSLNGFAQPQGFIMSITKPLRMSKKDPEPFKDYYLNIGETEGIRTGDTFVVTRDFPLINAMSAQSGHMMRVVIGELTTINVSSTSTLARLTALSDPKVLPALNSYSPMVGDRVELKSSLPYRR